eukprot:TRINITY_DN159_c0_g1_i1.p1 TRINITY_DN159_c0_g1~~TRINITY_DN159_c0_g1_i1.p1  ORF type:complete len:172 (-),score=41.87 TRINITY_DN159_c0_g1_i1:27-542(-)
MPAKYSKKPENPNKSAWAKATNIRVHFKNTRETAMAVKGMNLTKAQQYLRDVIDKKQAVPFRKFTGGASRKAQGKNIKGCNSAVRWPKKSAMKVLDLLQNLESNAEQKELDIANLQITHVQVNQAPQMRRRTYRAHGRIGPYLCSPCHIEIMVTEKESTVKGAKGKQLATQ